MTAGVLVAVGPVDFEAALLEAADDQGIHVVRRCVDVADLLAVAASRQARVAVVSAQLRGLDSEVVSRLHDEEVAVLGMTPESESADEAALRRIGVEIVLAADDLDELAEAADLAAAEPLSADGPGAGPPDGDAAEQPTRGRRGTVVAVWGPTGAPGRSTLALGLASELAELQAPTLLVDADVYGGSAAQMLGLLDEASGLLAATRSANTGQLSGTTLARHARAVNPMLRVLTGLPRADRWTEVRPGLLRSVLETARSLCAFTVVDCGFNVELDEEISYDTAAPRRNGSTVAALEMADVVVVVGSADPVGLGRLVRALADLATLVPGAAPRVVVNRMRSTLGWSAGDIETTLARTSGVQGPTILPSDVTACDKSVVHGRTLTECAPNARLTKEIRLLAHSIAGLRVGSSKGRRAARAR